MFVFNYGSTINDGSVHELFVEKKIMVYGLVDNLWVGTR
jgi:hypothetical protein